MRSLFLFTLLCIFVHTLTITHYVHSLLLVLVVMTKSKEFKTKIYSHAHSLILSNGAWRCCCGSLAVVAGLDVQYVAVWALMAFFSMLCLAVVTCGMRRTAMGLALVEVLLLPVLYPSVSLRLCFLACGCLLFPCFPVLASHCVLLCLPLCLHLCL